MALIACPGCARHVRRTETSCPFCHAALDLTAVADRPVPRTRLSRSAAFAFGAALSTQLTGCPGSSGTDAGSPDVPEDARDVADTGAGPDDAPASVDAGAEDGGADAPAPVDAGLDAGGGPAPLYGGAPAE
jgi:hypothetical protein